MNGVVYEIEPTGQEAADRRHPPVINRVQFPSAGHDEIKVGEMLFEGSRENASHQETYGATKAAEATKKTLTGTGDGTATTFNFDFGEVVPGSVKIVTNDPTAKEVTDNGDGTLGGESESGTGTVDYATGHVSVTFTAAPANTMTVTATAIPGAGFVGIANDALDASEDDGVNVVLHGTICEGIAKYNGSAASEEQLKFLSRHGIW